MDSQRAVRWRWAAVFVFVLSSTLNYMDRQVMSVFAPHIMGALGMTLTQYGWLLSAFSIAYTAAALFAGWFLDSAGVNRAISAAVAWWSAAEAAAGFAPGFRLLAVARAALGIGESAGVPAVGKLNGIYLRQEEFALGAAVNQIGLSLGAAIVPFAASLSDFNWRTAFVATGLLGFLWIPLWQMTSRRVPPSNPMPASTSKVAWRTPQLWLLVAANIAWMGSYLLWTNWGMIYFTRVYALTVKQAAAYLWLPPLISNLGGFFGGWLSWRWIKRAVHPVAARRRAVWISAAGGLITLLLPLAATPAVASVLVSASYFFALAGSVNIYALPIDVFGPERAGFAIAALTCGFGVLQTVSSPLIGHLAGQNHYTAVLYLITVPLLLAAALLQPLPLARAK